jgi:hypothetical protein
MNYATDWYTSFEWSWPEIGFIAALCLAVPLVVYILARKAVRWWRGRKVYEINETDHPEKFTQIRAHLDEEAARANLTPYGSRPDESARPVTMAEFDSILEVVSEDTGDNYARIKDLKRRLDALESQGEARGCCPACNGSGQIGVTDIRSGVTEYRECHVCNGTGESRKLLAEFEEWKRGQG